MKLGETLKILFICGLLSLVANVVGTKYNFVEAIPGMLLLIALAFIGILAWQSITRRYSRRSVRSNPRLYPDLPLSAHSSLYQQCRR